MVCNWGMSDKVGPMAIAKKESQVFLGKDFGQQENISEDTAKIIDSEVRLIVDKAYNRALDILKRYRPLLDKLSEALLEKETLNADEIYEIALENAETAKEKEFITRKYAKVNEMKISFIKDDEDQNQTESDDNEEKSEAESANVEVSKENRENVEEKTPESSDDKKEL